MDSDKDFTYSINLADLEDTLTAGAGGSSSGYYNSTDTITLGSNHITNGGVTLNSPYTFTGTLGAGLPNSVYTTSATGTSSPWAYNPTSTKIQLDGEGADIRINDWSLIDAIQKIEERLNILHPNTELETEWEELRALGEQYRKLEQHIKDKQATWDKLKAMPPPVID